MTMVLQARNVSALLALGVDHLAHEGQRGESRAGPVIVAPMPVMSVYERPKERVLLSAKRDANPFFHLFEALWMLAGRDDAASLSHYVTDFGKRFSEKDGTIHGAYGRRWRRALGFDQLEAVVRRLRENPDDRQCVIQMWDGVETFEHGDKDLGFNDLLGDWKDRPCNTHVYLRVRELGKSDPPLPAGTTTNGRVLDLTVCCRSNDVIWGAYGANAVHFSVLQEYLAGRIGVGVGRMYQLSNNFHGYVDALDRLGDPRLLMEEGDEYESGVISASPIGDDWSAWDDDLRHFMAWHDWLWKQTSEYADMSVSVHNTTKNDWFMGTPVVMTQAMWLWRAGRRDEALARCHHIEASDWREACQGWMGRRLAR